MYCLKYFKKMFASISVGESIARVEMFAVFLLGCRKTLL